MNEYFFFSSRRRHTRWNCDWSSDVCSSDLVTHPADDGCVETDLRIHAEELEEQEERAFAGAHFEWNEEERVADNGLEAADRERAQVVDTESEARHDQYQLDHENAAAQILERDRLDETARTAVIEIGDLPIELDEERAVR